MDLNRLLEEISKEQNQSLEYEFYRDGMHDNVLALRSKNQLELSLVSWKYELLVAGITEVVSDTWWLRSLSVWDSSVWVMREGSMVEYEDRHSDVFIYWLLRIADGGSFVNHKKLI